MKPIHRQIPFINIHISPSTSHQQIAFYHNLLLTKQKKRHQHYHLPHHQSHSNHQSTQINRKHRQSRSASCSHSQKSHSKNKHHPQPKTYIIDKSVKEEYNLEYRPNKLSQKQCTEHLHECKYIDHYIGKIKSKLKEQRNKNSLLKRRNHELTQQNQLFNQYFQAFEERYQNLKQQNQHQDHQSNNKQKNTFQHQSRDHSKHCSRNHKSRKHKHSEGQSTNEYLGNKSEYEIGKRHQIHSCVTRASSRHQSRQNFNFPSRFDQISPRKY